MLQQLLRLFRLFKKNGQQNVPDYAGQNLVLDFRLREWEPICVFLK